MNLKYLYTTAQRSVARYREHLERLKFDRSDFVGRQARKFYTEQEVAQAESNRRSSTTDEALIADFMSFEQPEHLIPMDSHFWSAIQQTHDMFEPPTKLFPIAYPDLRYYPWNLQPNAEAPWNLPEFRFRPTLRDVDSESEVPKLQERLKGHTFNLDPTFRFKTEDYLRIKHSAGLIDNTNPSFHNLYSEIFYYNRTLIHQIKDGSAPFWKDGKPVPYYWHTLHARAHVVANDEPDKIRAVFGAPKLILQAENMFIWPLQATYLNNPDIGRLLWGRETIRGGWRKLFSEVHTGGTPSTFLSLDWSQFDKRLLFVLMNFVHMIWRSYFCFDLYQPTSFYPNAKTDPVRIERLWTWMCYSILHTPILLPDGRLFEWTTNGFGSGFQQTQLMDSFANMIMILTCLSSLGINIKSKHFWIRVQGDDSLIAFYEAMFVIYGPTFLDKLADSALFYFNAKLSAKKSQISNRLTHMSVLSFYNRFGLPYRTDEDLLRHLLFPETPGGFEELVSSALGLAYAACGCSERFHALCKHIFERGLSRGDKPTRKAFHWMIRTGLLTEDDVDEIISHPFPERLALRANAWIHTPRTKSQKERLWPSEPGPRGRFFFLPTVT